jgi:hypothetical protein
MPDQVLRITKLNFKKRFRNPCQNFSSGADPAVESGLKKGAVFQKKRIVETIPLTSRRSLYSYEVAN